MQAKCLIGKSSMATINPDEWERIFKPKEDNKKECKNMEKHE